VMLGARRGPWKGAGEEGATWLRGPPTARGSTLCRSDRGLSRLPSLVTRSAKGAYCCMLFGPELASSEHL